MIRQGTTHDNQRTECTEIQADLIYNYMYIQMHILFLNQYKQFYQLIEYF